MKPALLKTTGCALALLLAGCHQVQQARPAATPTPAVPTSAEYERGLADGRREYLEDHRTPTPEPTPTDYERGKRWGYWQAWQAGEAAQ